MQIISIFRVKPVWKRCDKHAQFVSKLAKSVHSSIVCPVPGAPLWALWGGYMLAQRNAGGAGQTIHNHTSQVSQELSIQLAIIDIVQG